MAMIDIDLNEFSTNDLIDELIERLERKNVRNHEKSQIQSALENAVTANFSNMLKIRIRTLNNVYKMEHISKIWNKYTPQQIETLLPE